LWRVENARERAYGASKTRVNALVARGHPRLSNLVAARKDVDGRDKPDKPGHDDPGTTVGRYSRIV
jgi:hypothetical protein